MVQAVQHCGCQASRASCTTLQMPSPTNQTGYCSSAFQCLYKGEMQPLIRGTLPSFADLYSAFDYGCYILFLLQYITTVIKCITFFIVKFIISLGYYDGEQT